MKLGIFDSGLGGLLIADSLKRELPEYSYSYLGDTKRMPYGNRSAEAIFEFTLEGVRYLLEQRGCAIVIIACNTASSEALRRIQQGYLAQKFPDRRVLGVLIPTAEAARGLASVGVLATSGTVRSGTYPVELKKISPATAVFQQAAPLLAPLVEQDGLKWAEPIVAEYMKPLLERGAEGIILGCTHYVALKDMARKAAGPNVKVYSQDELVAESLRNYLHRHPELETRLSKDGSREYAVTDPVESPAFSRLLDPEELSSLMTITL